MAELDGLVSFWLLPAAAAAAQFAHCIDGLSAKHGAPRFAPHITIFSGSNAGGVHERAWHEVLPRAVQGIAPFTVQVTGVGESDQLFKTVFLQIVLNSELQALHRRIRAVLPAADDYHFEPHLSLIYREMPQPAREAIAHGIRPPESFVCNALAVIAPGPAGWADIASWRELDAIALQGP